uniref:Uncharacterized protein n=1 Tax=Solanum lycopersicum TaxID=4081 RepID=A0A3Q7FM98_SOLLC
MARQFCKRRLKQNIALMHRLRALNKVTIKNKYPIPLIADFFDRLGQAKLLRWTFEKSTTKVIYNNTLEENVEYLKKAMSSSRVKYVWMSLRSGRPKSGSRPPK